MAKITMSREALECHLAAIEDRISKTATVMVMAKDYVDTEDSRMVTDVMELVDEQMVSAQHAIDKLKAEAGIKPEVQAAA